MMGWNGLHCVHVIMALFLLVLLECDQVASQPTTEPVNVNWVVALPWDISNTLRAPFGGPISLLLSSFTACILLFGLLLAPVNYILGYPERHYHTYREEGVFGRSFTFAPKQSGNYTGRFIREVDDEHADMADVLVHLFQEVSSRLVFEDTDFDGNCSRSGRELALPEEALTPGFLESIFLLVPEENEICRLLMVCHAHGFLGFLPPTFLRLYQWISKHFVTIPEPYKDAIMIGLDDQGACALEYDTCPKTMFQLFRGSMGAVRQYVVKALPQGTRDIWERFYQAKK